MIKKVKSSELNGIALDWAVAVAMGKRPKIITGQEIMTMCYEGVGEFRPSVNWWHAGMLIEMYCLLFDTDDQSIIWAKTPNSPQWSGAEKHTTAACRAVIDSELSKEFEIDFPDYILIDA